MVRGQVSVDEKKSDSSAYFDDLDGDAALYALERTMLRSRFCWRVAVVAHAPHSMLQGRLNEADSAARGAEVNPAVWLWDSTTGSATMVISSSSNSASSRPHIGSGGGTFFAGIPESQCPAALPTQQAIVFAWLNEALAMRNGSEATKRHTKHKMPNERNLCFLSFFAAILKPDYWAGSCVTGFLTSFILHFRQMPRFFDVTSSCMGQT
jgi:hypothetical protein